MCPNAAAVLPLSGTKLQKSAKKIVELNDHSYAPDCLTNFEYEANEMTVYGNYVNLLKINSLNYVK